MEERQELIDWRWMLGLVVCVKRIEPWADGSLSSETVWKTLQANLLVYNVGETRESGLWNTFGQDG